MLKRLLFAVLMAFACIAQATVYSLPWGPKPQFVDTAGAPMSGGTLTFYAAGTTTLQNTYTDSTGVTPNSNPMTLNSRGEPANEIWLTGGASYKVLLKDSSGATTWTVDNLTGVNDVTAQLGNEWVASGLTATYVSATSFTVTGDQRTTLHVGRRLKTTNTAGTVYSTITASAFGAVTTVTVVNDSGTLDSGLSSVSYGVLANANTSLPSFQAKGDIVSQSAAGTLARLAVGTDGYVLTPLAGATTGLAYLPPNMGFSLVNGYLDFSVAASALTVAIKGFDGNDPSATNPVYVLFRSATAATGSLTLRKLTAATSVVVSSGSTLGATNSVAFRVWVVGYDDAGTFRLAVINCVSTAAGAGAGRDVTGIYPLSGWGIASSTAEGGAGAADSSQIFYTGTAVSSKAYVTLGYATWESGLAAVGTWSAGPTRAQLWGPTVPLPGQVIQVQRTATGAVSTGTTLIPDDDTIPQITEGDQYMSQAITPSSAANALEVRAQALLSTSQAGNCGMALALFQDATANALMTARFNSPSADYINMLPISATILAAGTASTTLRARAGAGAAGTTTFNGSGGGGRKYGGVSNSFIEVREIMGANDAANDPMLLSRSAA
jgi:hypothetical protein